MEPHYWVRLKVQYQQEAWYFCYPYHICGAGTTHYLSRVNPSTVNEK